MSVSEALFIVVDDILSLYLLASPTAVLVTGIEQLLHPASTGYPVGYPGVELLNFLGGIIDSRETQDC
jgi:hypothetical protein